MSLIDYERSFPWTDKCQWLAPENDWSAPIHCSLVTEETDWILSFLDDKDTCIQAGGNIGLWPARYATVFDHVVSFEACPENYACLETNMAAFKNITHVHAALGCSSTPVDIKRHPNKLDRSGACYVEQSPNGKVSQSKLDDWLFPGKVDLIHLDIEGWELYALQGAEQTIRRHWPVIALENRLLPHMKIKPALSIIFLQKLGYKVVAQRKYDVILKR